MMRVRIPGGQLTASQVRAIAEVSKEYGRDLADITDRQNIQFHWLRIEDIPAVWERLAEVGLSSQQACGDVPRNILGCPVAGLDADEVIDASAALRATEELALSRPDLANLPRKFKTAISGCANQCTAHEINDVAFVGVIGPDGTPGFDLWVGGGLSTNPMLGQRLGAFVPEARVPEVWAAVAELFRDYGYRRLRSRARLKFLVADWGVERFREVLEREYLGGEALADGPAPPPVGSGSRDHLGVHRQRDGRYYVGVAPHTGRTSGTQLWQVADLAEAFGSGRVRLTTEQKLLILDVPEANGRGADRGARGHRPAGGSVGVPPRDHGLHRHRVLQARDRRDQGPRPRAVHRAGPAAAGLRLADLHQRERLPELVRPVPAGRHRAQGLDRGRPGGLPGAPRAARSGADPWIRRASCAASRSPRRGSPTTSSGLLRNYQADRAAGEEFATWVRRADPALLAVQS